MPKINSAITVTYLAWDTANSVGKTGDNANHTIRIVADGTEGTPAASPAEVDSTNLKGVYKIVIAADENTGALMTLGGISATADVIIQPITWTNESNVAQISGDATSADNLELQYDTTGVTGDTFPATQAQVGNISTGAGGLSALVTAFAKAGAETETNTYTSTQEGDGTYHIVEDDAGSTEFYYQATVNAGGAATSWKWRGYVQSKADTVAINYYNWATTSYKQITTLTGVNGTTPIDEIFTVPTGATGTGANQGKVRLQFVSTTTTAIATDRLLCEFSQSSQSAGYAEGAIWYNDGVSNTNTVDYVDGTADNPVSTWAAALTLSTSLGINKFHVSNGSTVTLSAGSDNYEIYGWEWVLALGGQSIAGTYVRGATVIGTGTGAGARFFYCKMALGGALSVADCGMKDCSIAGDITLSAAGTYLIDACFSGVAGTATPSIDFGAAVGNTNLNMRHYSGGIEIKNMGSAGTDKMSLEGFGQLVLNANCDPSNSPVIAIRGLFTITDNVSGGFAAGGGTVSDDARYDTTLTEWIQDVLEGDVTTDVSGTPYETVVLEKDTSTELIRKKLYQADDTAVSSTDHLVGQRLESAP